MGIVFWLGGVGMTRLHVVTPAKVNLGLEVIRRRGDGYHELVTIMQAVSIYDRFVWTETGERFEYDGPPGVPREVDLVWRALSLADGINEWTGQLRVEKHIPVAAGLGGGSSDAALALRLAMPDSDTSELHRQAATLGSDVPFFLHGGSALATVTGTEIEAVDLPPFWLVIVTPRVEIPRKTATLYRGLNGSDFADGAAIRDMVEHLRAGGLPPTTIPNTFTRQLLGYPSIRYAYDCLRRIGVGLVSVSGAGPSLYALVTSWREAVEIVSRLPGDVGATAIARTLPSELSDGGDATVGIRRMALALRGVSES